MMTGTKAQAEAKPFKKGDKVTFSYMTRTGTKVTGTGTVDGKSQNSARINVKPVSGGANLTLWPSALKAA